MEMKRKTVDRWEGEERKRRRGREDRKGKKRRDQRGLEVNTSLKDSLAVNASTNSMIRESIHSYQLLGLSAIT